MALLGKFPLLQPSRSHFHFHCSGPQFLYFLNKVNADKKILVEPLWFLTQRHRWPWNQNLWPYIKEQIRSHKVAWMRQPIPDMHLNLLDHTPQKIKLGCGVVMFLWPKRLLARKICAICRTGSAIFSHFDSLVLNGFAPSFPIIFYASSALNSFVLLSWPISLWDQSTLSFILVLNNPNLNDHSLRLMAISWLKNLK